MTKLLYAASAAAILTVVGYAPAMAQSSMSAPMITCKDISTMDRETARGVVFYLSGFKAASGLQSAAGSGTTGTESGTSGSTAADAGSASSGSTGTESGSGSSGSSSSDTTGSTTAAGGTSGSSDTSGAASGASSGASGAVVAQLPGFSAIDIDKIIADCASTPDRQLSDMMGSSSQ